MDGVILSRRLFFSLLFKFTLKGFFNVFRYESADNSDSVAVDIHYLISLSIKTSRRRYHYLFNKFMDKLGREFFDFRYPFDFVYESL